jgi:hypothetical protein
MSTSARGVRPSLYDIIFVIWAIVAPVGFGYRLLNSDGDLARHLRLGQIMLDQRALLTRDVFSFTKAGQPFLAFEYGSELVYAAAYKAAGLAGVAVLAGLVLALTYALVARFLIRRGGDPLLAYLISMAAAVLSAAHWLARPHLFTMLFVVILLELLQRTDRRALLAYAALFVVWANLHGGFSFGCILIALYAVGEAVEGKLASDPQAWYARARHHAAALGVALAASLINPNGVRLLAHVFGFFGNSTILGQTQEFMSPDFHTINGKLFLLALLGVVTALAWSRRRPTVPVLLILLATISFALVSQRNIELFALTALPLVALHLDGEWRALPALRGAKAVFQREHVGRYAGAGAAMVAVLLALLALAGGTVAGIAVVPNRFDEGAFPVRAVAQGRRAGLSGRMFSNFIWGGYLMHEWPEQRVFIDGGTDHYGEKVFNQYIQIWSLDQGWREALKRWDISLVLLPPGSRLADELKRDQGWATWYCDSTAVLLQRPPGDGGSARAKADSSRADQDLAPRRAPLGAPQGDVAAAKTDTVGPGASSAGSNAVAAGPDTNAARAEVPSDTAESLAARKSAPSACR